MTNNNENAVPLQELQYGYNIQSKQHMFEDTYGLNRIHIRRTVNAMVNILWTQRQTVIFKTLRIKLKIEQHESH